MICHVALPSVQIVWIYLWWLIVTHYLTADFDPPEIAVTNAFKGNFLIGPDSHTLRMQLGTDQIMGAWQFNQIILILD